MTQNEFKQALLRGQGRCALAARKDPERYRKIVLWACSHEVAYDPQCEGSKAWFVSELIRCYPDEQPFVEEAAKALHNPRIAWGWKVLYLAELLQSFALEGNKTARRALRDKYKGLYAALIARKRAPQYRISPLLEDYTNLCQVLALSRKGMIRIAGDIGTLYREKSFVGPWHFDWLFATHAATWRKDLEREAASSEAIALFLRKGDEEARRTEKQKPRPRPARELKGIALSLWLERTADPETVESYANTYLQEQDPEQRAQALKAFCRCPFPGDPAPVLTDARSEYQPLRDAALEALEHIRHPAAREFALELAENDPETAFALLLRNHRKKDRPLLISLATSVPVDFESETCWHGQLIALLDAEESGAKTPPELLLHYYEKGYCSYCRLSLLRRMSRRRLLTPEILEECLWDSNADIRTWAARHTK